ncbi:MAG TPA: OadG family protein [Firmicutes bacterium]|nr:OadG family protein [Bacillota bacterium]
MDNIVLSLEVLVIGLSVVMLTLCFLYLVLLCFGKAVARVTSCHSAEDGEAPQVGLSIEEEAGPDEIIAVITAAVSAFLGRSPLSFSLVSVKPQTGAAGSAWITAGRKNLLNKSRELALLRRGRKI